MPIETIEEEIITKKKSTIFTCDICGLKKKNPTDYFIKQHEEECSAKQRILNLKKTIANGKRYYWCETPKDMYFLKKFGDLNPEYGTVYDEDECHEVPDFIIYEADEEMYKSRKLPAWYRIKNTASEYGYEHWDRSLCSMRYEIAEAKREIEYCEGLIAELEKVGEPNA